MSSRTTRALLACLTAVVLVALSGCSGADSAKESPPASAAPKPVTALAKGTCWGAEQLPETLGAAGFDAWVKKYAGGDKTLGASMRDDAAFSTPIACTKPHTLELYNIVGLDPRLDAKIKDYTDVLDPSTPLYRAVRDQVYGRCLAPSVYGAAQRRAGGLPVQLGPSLSAKGGLHVAWDPFPAHLWAKGQHKFVCTFEQDDPGTLMFADLPTRKTPIAARVCVNTPRTYVPCRSPHQAEDIAEMTLDTAIERGQITGRAAVRKGPKGQIVVISDAQYAKLDRICQTLFRSVSTVGGGVTGRAYLGSVDMWPDKTGSYLASCFALKPFDPPPKSRGTVFNRR
jgi:hypothetical protein